MSSWIKKQKNVKVDKFDMKNQSIWKLFWMLIHFFHATIICQKRSKKSLLCAIARHKLKVQLCLDRSIFVTRFMDIKIVENFLDSPESIKKITKNVKKDLMKLRLLFFCYSATISGRRFNSSRILFVIERYDYKV